MSIKPPVGPNTPINSGIADEGVALPWRRQVNFVGAAVTATDDSANDQTDVTITGGAGATFRSTHTFAIKGTVSAADTTPSFFVSKASTESISIVKARYKVASGSSITFKIQKNGSDLTGYGTSASPLTATTSAAETVSTQALADSDELDLVLVGVAGPATDITITLVIEHTL